MPAASSGAEFRFPTPANLRPSNEPPPGAGAAPGEVTVAAPAASPRAVPRLFGMEMFRLDPDLKPALEDMFAGQGRGADWQRWLEQFCNEAIRSYLGR